MTTEAQARESMICPQTRHPSNKFQGETCLGAKCMHWRWLREEHEIHQDRRGFCGTPGRTA